MSCQAFFINLDRAQDRRRFIEAEISAAGLTAQRIVACEGRNLNIPQFARSYFADAGHLSNYQIACSISHLSVMKEILARDIEFALILEDDAILANDLAAVIDQVAATIPLGWDIVRLCSPSKRAVKPLAKLVNDRQLVRYSRVPIGRAGYLVSKAGAQKLLRPRAVSRPGDVEIAHPWLLDLDIYGVEPPPIAQERKALPSSIGNTRGDIHWLRRAIPEPRRVVFNIRKLGLSGWTKCFLSNAIGRRLRALKR